MKMLKEIKPQIDELFRKYYADPAYNMAEDLIYSHVMKDTTTEEIIEAEDYLFEKYARECGFTELVLRD